MLDLVLPLECGGCGAPSTRWCPACARQLAVKADEPHLITPRVDPGVPVLSLGRYAGARRQAIVAAKEHGRADLIAPLAVALQTGLQRLLTWGLVGDSVGLSSADRQRNIVGRVKITKPVEGLAKAVLVVDDIVTTGATASESVRVLQIAGAQVAGVLAIANA
jgi:predicted amidophosphoribosyltransferase